MVIGLHFEGSAIEIEAAEKVWVALAIILIPQNAPLGQEVGAIRIANVIGHWPGQKFAAGIFLNGAPGDGWGIYDRHRRESLLAGRY